MNDADPILVFDGTCLLCNRSVQFILRHDVRRRHRFAAMQSPAGAALMRRHGFDPHDPDSVLLVEGHRAYADSDAVLRVLADFGGIYRMASVLRVLPRGIRDRLYRWIACNRHRWFGGSDTCWLPAPEYADRFIE